MLIALSIIRLTHVLPGHDLPEDRRRWVRTFAVSADVLQIAMGIVAWLLPLMADDSQLSDTALLGVLAAFALVNVSVNIAVAVAVQRAETMWCRELHSKADHGDKDATMTLHDREVAAETDHMALDGFALDAVTDSDRSSVRELARAAVRASRSASTPAGPPRPGHRAAADLDSDRDSQSADGSGSAGYTLGADVRGRATSVLM